MRKSRFTEDQIIEILQEFEAGVKLDQLCSQHKVSQTMFSKWRTKYGRITISDAKRLKSLLAEVLLNNKALKGRLKKTGNVLPRLEAVTMMLDGGAHNQAAFGRHRPA